MTDDNSFTDWKEKYYQLLAEFQNIQTSHESALQENHVLKRELNTSQANNKHLTEELESVESRHAAAVDQLEQKWSEKFENLKRENQDLKSDRRDLEIKIDKLNMELSELQMVEKNPQVSFVATPANVSLEETKYLEEIDKCKENIAELENERDELQERVKSALRQIEDLQERCEYLESNLTAKREELEEKLEQVDTLQEKNMELTIEINSLRTNEQHGQKGNSLFAEVDDQRQKLRKQLEDQNKQFFQMKKIYKESRQEIIRLKQENQEILNAMESCKRLFETGCVFEKESYVNKIDDLELKIDNLSQLNQRYQETFKERNEKAVAVLLEHYQNDKKNYNAQLFSCLQHKSSLEEMLGQCQQDCARLQLESIELKTKLRAEKAQRERLEKLKLESPEMKKEELGEAPRAKPIVKDWRQVLKEENHSKKTLEPIRPSLPIFPISIKRETLEPTSTSSEKENVVSQPQYRSINVKPTESDSVPVKKEPTTGAANTFPVLKMKPGFTIKHIKISSKKNKPTDVKDP